MELDNQVITMEAIFVKLIYFSFCMESSMVFVICYFQLFTLCPVISLISLSLNLIRYILCNTS